MSDDRAASHEPLVPAVAKRRRRRMAISCEACRRRKLRCDQQSPCQSCIRARTTMLCVYRDGQPSVPRVGGGFTHSKLTQRWSANDALSSGGSEGLLPRPHHGAGGGDGGGRSIHTNARLEPSERESDLSSRSIPHHTAPVGTQVQPRLRQVPSKTKMFGPTHWVHIAAQLPALGAIDSADVEPSLGNSQAEARSLRAEISTLRHKIRGQRPARVYLSLPGGLLKALPSKRQCDRLVQCYFQTFEPLYRVLHLPSFERDYARLWDDQRHGPLCESFEMQLLLVTALGTTIYCADLPEERDSLRSMAQSWIQTAQWWLMGPSEKATQTLEGLQVYCLLLLCRQATYNGVGNSSWISASSLLNAAFRMGLHRDPATFPALNKMQAEMRKRLWTTVLELTIQESLDFSVPLTLSEDDFDTPLPSNIPDRMLGLGGSKIPGLFGVEMDCSLQLELAKTQRLRLMVLRSLNDFHSRYSYTDVEEMSEQLRMACRDIASFFRAARESNEPTLRYTEFHRILTDIHVRRFMLALHWPFMLRSLKDPRFLSSRSLCVNSAMVILHHADGLETNLASPNAAELVRVATVGRCVWKGPFSFEAILVVALEVLQQLQTDSTASGVQGDALDEMAKAGRAPLIQLLERVRDQLLSMAEQGSTSFMRYLFTVALVCQMQAMEAGKPAKPAVAASLTAALRHCRDLLKEKLALAPRDRGFGQQVEDPISTEGSTFDFGLGDPSITGWDFSSLFNFDFDMDPAKSLAPFLNAM